MSELVIANPELDPELTLAVRTAWESVTPHWRALMPPITAHLTKVRFDRLPELSEFREFQNRQPGWRKTMWQNVQVACPDFGERNVALWLRTITNPPDYYFGKELLRTVAKVVWLASEQVRQLATLSAADTEAATPTMVYLAFRDSLPAFFLNPEYLEERKRHAWEFMVRIDRILAPNPETFR